jgi:hypothetical protein
MRYLLIAVMMLLLVGCTAAHQKQPGHFRKEKYVNRQIGFSLTFKAPWQIFTSPRNLSPDLRSTYQFYQRQNHEVLYVGKLGGPYVTAAATASKPSVDLDLYVRIFLALAHKAIENVLSREALSINDIPMIKLEYVGRMGETRVTHLEYYMDIADRRVRVIFTAKVGAYEDMKPEFEGIISSIQLAREIGTPRGEM